jgi:hypothetical protein
VRNGDSGLGLGQERLKRAGYDPYASYLDSSKVENMHARERVIRMKKRGVQGTELRAARA